MARRYIRPRLTDQAGNVLEGALLRVLEAGTSTTVDLYAASAGGSVLSQPRTTDARGEVEVWLVDGTGDIDLEWSADLGVTTVAASGRTTTFSTFTEFVEAPSEGVATHAALPDLATSGHPASIISGLGGAALLDVGTGAGTVAAGDDSRITGAVPKSLIDAAGDLLVGSAADTVARLGIGTAGQVLTVNAGATAPEWATVSSGAVSVIARTVLGSAAASVDFTSIPATYENLMVSWLVRSTSAAAWTVMWCRFNNDSGSNYESGYHRSLGASSVAGSETAQTKAYAALLVDDGGTAGFATQGSMLVPAYARTVFNKGFVATSSAQYGVGTAKASVGAYNGTWVTTDAVNRVTFFPNSGNFVAGSVFTLYGVAGA